ncbi:2-succinyl-6-hydroxy-2,4-cyclohexadiene-1-carboxylate synthase [Salinicoccus sp. HZC-1]|uniref:2-succinyl-6-hydroxy-2, 4-cyclohexadiene-1-carboxylate synthase n=1 Tax=Salinicoccus sp. HZC-1 TaxID=3385497 RepID=UPI00398AAC2D
MNINYKFNDTDSSETVLLLHGFLSDMNSMKTVADQISEHFNVLSVDLPGFGKTPSTGNYTMDDVSESLASLIESLNLGKVHIIGYSMGGRVAVSFMVNHPEKVQSAVLESTSPGISDISERQRRFQVDYARAEKIVSDFSAFINEWEQMGLFSTQNAMDSETQLSQRASRLAQNPDGAADSLLKYGTGIQRSYWNDLKSVNSPVLLIAGEQDKKFAAINRKMNDLLPNSQFVLIQGAGHNIHMEAADKFGIIILEFLIGG